MKRVRWHRGDYEVARGKTWERKEPGGVCELKVEIGGESHRFYHDGCSGKPLLGKPAENSTRAKTWGQLFHAACVYHDHCYHHEPATNGHTQKQCDKFMRDEMYAICEAEFARKRGARLNCKRAATSFYAGVRAGGRKHYRFHNEKAPWKRLYDRR
ncbi:MAG: phospholipase A2 [Myxococcota bacterium]